jgi:hypothetical protein
MDSALRDPFSSVAEKVIGYLPNLFAGLVLIGIGLLLGWVVKRIVYQLCVIVRIDRLLGGFRWSSDFSKADVRHAMFNAIGTVASVLVFLVFLNAALEAMQLSVLSSLIEKSVLIVPRLIVALLIVGLGWVVARWLGVTIRKGLAREDVPRASLISRFVKSVLILFFSAMALVELDIAREIVVTGFTVTIITLGAVSVVVTAIGGKGFVRKVVAQFEDE